VLSFDENAANGYPGAAFFHDPTIFAKDGGKVIPISQ
jgi:hypothetical protein